MKNITLLVCLLTIFLQGCIRTYRMEHSSCFDTKADCSGNVSSATHSEGKERSWIGFWPFAPRHIEP